MYSWDVGHGIEPALLSSPRRRGAHRCSSGNDSRGAKLARQAGRGLRRARRHRRSDRAAGKHGRLRSLGIRAGSGVQANLTAQICIRSPEGCRIFLFSSCQRLALSGAGRCWATVRTHDQEVRRQVFRRSPDEPQLRSEFVILICLIEELETYLFLSQVRSILL